MSRSNIDPVRRLILQADKHISRSAADAIEHLKEALGLLKKAKANDTKHEDLQQRALGSLGKAYLYRPSGSRSENIEQAIGWYNKALRVYYKREQRDDRREYMSGQRIRALLALAYDQRIRGSREENIDQILVYTDSLDLDAKKDIELLAAAAIVRGKAFRDRAEGLGIMDLVLARVCFENALKKISHRRNPHRWAEAHFEMGKTLLNFPSGSEDENWRNAEKHFQHALTVFRLPGEPICYARVQVQLGNYYVRRSQEDTGANYRTTALGHYSMALNQLRAVDNPREWSEAHVALARLAGASARDIAVFHLESALEPLTDKEDRAIRISVLRDLSYIHLRREAWRDAVPKFTEAIELIQAEVRDAHTVGGRRTAVEGMSELANSLAYCHYRLGELDTAVRTLESGKSLLLSEKLRWTGKQIIGQPAVRRQQVARLYRQIRKLEATQYGGMGWIENSDRLSDLRRRLDILEDRSQEATAHSISISAIAPEEPGTALVFLLISPAGGAVFILRYQDVSVAPENVISLPKLTSQEMRAWLGGSGSGRGWLDLQRKHNEGKIDDDRWRAAIAGVCHKLWGAVAGKLCQKLQELGVSAFNVIPSAGMQFLPIHAASQHGTEPINCLIDRFTIRYAPSAFVLRVSATRATSTHMAGTPLVAGVSKYTSLSPLPSVRDELELVSSVLRAQMLFDKQVSRKRLLRDMPSASIVHLACHGAAWALGGTSFRLAWVPPTVLHFAEDGLSFQDILNMDLRGVRLVCLSACDTGAVDASLSWDEFEGLANVFLQAGAAAVVSSLWSVDDRSTSLLMHRLYANLHEQGLSAADALREAQIWLRNSTRQSLALMYEEKIKRGQSVFMDAYANLLLDGDPEDRPYAHPYYWAPFYLTGT